MGLSMFDPAQVDIKDFNHSLGFSAAFDTFFATRLNHRAATFRAAFGRLPARPTIVETGCLRVAGNWAGDGQSTFLFDCFAASEGGRVWSVDISPESIFAARAVTSPNVQLVLNDSVAFLSAFHAPIDLLYLDSLDADENSMASAQHHLMELTASMPNLRPGSVVLVDDTRLSGGTVIGKGRLMADYMARRSAKLIAQGDQFAWVL